MGSRIYVGENGELRQRFAAIAENYYRTELVKIDFTKPVEAASSINAWVANTTQGRLPNLVNSGLHAYITSTYLNITRD